MSRRPPQPLLAASLIVKDEAENLPACLAALAPLVDEIHVHDTGSTDGTPELAASLGALVSHGPWNGSFADARNEATTGWTARWVLAVDADEVVVADAPRLRALLERHDVDAYALDVDNLADEGAYTHVVARIFRPSAARWRGRVHEQLVAVGQRPLQVVKLDRDVLLVEHSGYSSTEVNAAKGARNAELLQGQLDALVAQGDAADRTLVATTLLDLGRSFFGADQQQNAVDAFEAVREMFPGTPQWVQATDFLARLLLADASYEGTLVLSQQLRDAAAPAMYCDWLDAQAFAQMGHFGLARTALDRVHEVVDPIGRQHDPARLHQLKAELAALEATLVPAGPTAAQPVPVVVDDDVVGRLRARVLQLGAAPAQQERAAEPA